MKKYVFMALMVSGSLFAQAEEERLLTLNEAMMRALESDERIEIQRRDVNIAGREVDRAWTIISPRLDASGSYERPEEEIRREGQAVVPEDNWRGTITARQPVFDGRVLPARRAGLALEEASFQELVHVVRTSLFDVTQTYYEALRAQKQVEISGQTVDLASKEVARAQARFNAGEARRTEVLRAEVAESRAFRNLVEARNAYEVAKSDLARRIGLPADLDYTIQVPDISSPPEDENLHALYALALQERNDLAAARNRIESGREERTVIRREGWPTLDLEYQHQFVDPESFTTRNNFWRASAVARYEFWDGGGRRISRLQQEERIRQAELRVMELEKSIQLEVQQALLDLQTVRENLATLRKEVDLADENFRTLSEQARVGLSTSLDVSTALNALDQARTDLARQEFDLEVAKKRLKAAIGTFGESLIELEK